VRGALRAAWSQFHDNPYLPLPGLRYRLAGNSDRRKEAHKQVPPAEPRGSLRSKASAAIAQFELAQRFASFDYATPQKSLRQPVGEL